MNTAATLVKDTDVTYSFALPQGWTLRQVATTLAREWLAPFRPEVVVKSARWVDKWTVQPIVEQPISGPPLWEKGISTAEYEHRLDCPDLAWLVQARSGRVKSILNSINLARLSVNPSRPMTFDMICSQEDLPETLFDPAKLAAFLKAHGNAGADRLLACLLSDHGFRVASAI